jgi:MoxR-like ATPase
MTAETNLPEALAKGCDLMGRIKSEISRIIVGHQAVLDDVLIALAARGHVLIEGVPGLGKTLLVKSLSASLTLSFKRVQCTPDLMPADILGTRVLLEDSSGRRSFEFQPGPVFTQILLADEINRATPKTQSALLEAMQEHSITIAGERRALPDPFFVLATQNPIEMEGTFPLPEAQLDRFFFKLLVSAPSLDELEQIVDRTTTPSEIEIVAAGSAREFLDFTAAVREIPVSQPVKRYALRLVAATHPTAPEAPGPVKRFVRYGASPRAAQALVLAAKARAALEGRFTASFEDVKLAALPALRHRLVLNFEGTAEGMTGDAITDAVLAAVPQLEKNLETLARRTP